MPPLAIGILLSLALSTADTPVTSEAIVLSLRSSGAVLVPVTINGQGPFTFLLDTGASHTVVSREVADRLRLPSVAKLLVSTEAGAQIRPVVSLERMTIGTASVEGLLPTVVALGTLREIESQIDGLVGQDFLSVFNYTLDYRQRRLLWSVPEAAGRVRLPLIRAGDRSLVQLAGNGRDTPVLMVPDSGAEVLVVFERKGRTAMEVDYIDRLVGLSSVASERVGRDAVLRNLKVGSVTLRNQRAVVLSGRGSSADEGDGLMPLHQFSSVSFNNTEGWMVVRR